jgi:hypothetical protein
VIGLIAVDAVIWALTVHAQEQFRSVAGGPVTSLGIVLGWIGSVGLLLAAILVLLAARQAHSYGRR